MKGIVKTIVFLLLAIMLITTSIEVIMYYTNMSKIAGISSYVLEISTQMAPLGLEDAETEIALTNNERSSIYSQGLVDSFQDMCEVYYSQDGQNITFVRNTNKLFISKMYDIELSYEHLGIMTDKVKIKSLHIYLDVIDVSDDVKQLETAVFAETYFNSKILRGTLGNNVGNSITYFDELYYTTLTDK